MKDSNACLKSGFEIVIFSCTIKFLSNFDSREKFWTLIEAESRGFGSTLDVNEYNNKKVLHAAASESDEIFKVEILDVYRLGGVSNKCFHLIGLANWSCNVDKHRLEIPSKIWVGLMKFLGKTTKDSSSYSPLIYALNTSMENQAMGSKSLMNYKLWSEKLSTIFEP